MIYLNMPEIQRYYGPKTGGLSNGRFDAEKRSMHKSNQNWEYEFGYMNGFCAYAIIERKRKGFIDLAAAAAFRTLSGKGNWNLITALNPERDTVQIQAMLDDKNVDLQYEYVPLATDRYNSKIYCVHQRRREQLFLFHPKTKSDPSEVAANPL